MIKTLLVAILALFSLTCLASSPRSMSYFLWPATEFRQALESSESKPSLCSLALTRTKKPNGLAISKAIRLRKKIMSLKSEFVMTFRQGSKSLNSNLRTRLEKAKDAVIAMVAEFGHEFGRAQGIVGTGIDQILNYDGFVPTEKELNDLRSSVLDQADRFLAAGSLSSSEFQAWRWNIITFQQTSATFEMAYPNQLDRVLPHEFWDKFSKIKTIISD